MSAVTGKVEKSYKLSSYPRAEKQNFPVSEGEPGADSDPCMMEHSPTAAKEGWCGNVLCWLSCDYLSKGIGARTYPGSPLSAAVDRTRDEDNKTIAQDRSAKAYAETGVLIP